MSFSWSLLHAGAMIGAGLMCALLGTHLVVLCAACAVSFAAWLLIERGRYSPVGRFGAANLVTSLRLALLLALGLSAAALPGPLAAATVLTVFLLDGVDGLLARRRGLASDFGARFDMEVDAFLVLLCSTILFRSGDMPGFILVPGLLRYAYVLGIHALALPDAPPSRLGRSLFSVLVAALSLALWPLPSIAVPACALATALVVFSFARSTTWSLAARPHTGRYRP